MVSETNGKGLTHNNYPPSKYKGAARKPSEVMLMDLAKGNVQVLLNKEEMVAMHPRRQIIEHPKWKGMGVFKHPKWSPDGSKFFWVYMLEVKGTNKKLVKSALLADRDGNDIRYISEIGQHAMWSTNDALLSYIRRDGFHLVKNPTGQDVMIHPINGEPEYPLIKNALGIHGSLNPDGDLFVTDIFDWPEKGAHAVLLYDVASGDYRELVRMRAEKDDQKNTMHPHPVWSRDGKRIYFNGSDTGQRRLYCIDLERFSFRPIERG
jgi:Tol biopolymer transport system component